MVPSPLLQGRKKDGEEDGRDGGPGDQSPHRHVDPADSRRIEEVGHDAEVPSRRKDQPSDFDSAAHVEELSSRGRDVRRTHDQHDPDKCQAPCDKVVVVLRIRPQGEYPDDRQCPQQPTAGLSEQPRPHGADGRAHAGPDEGGALPEQRGKDFVGNRLLVVRNPDFRDLQNQLKRRRAVDPRRPERGDEADRPRKENDLVLPAKQQREEEQRPHLRLHHHQRPADRGQPIPIPVKRVIHEQCQRGERETVLKTSKATDQIAEQHGDKPSPDKDPLRGPERRDLPFDPPDQEGERQAVDDAEQRRGDRTRQPAVEPAIGRVPGRIGMDLELVHVLGRGLLPVIAVNSPETLRRHLPIPDVKRIHPGMRALDLVDSKHQVAPAMFQSVNGRSDAEGETGKDEQQAKSIQYLTIHGSPFRC